MSSDAYRRGYARASIKAEYDEEELRERVAELEAALQSIVDMQTADEPVAYSWGLEYFNRAHKIAVDALGDN